MRTGIRDVPCEGKPAPENLPRAVLPRGCFWALLPLLMPRAQSEVHQDAVPPAWPPPRVSSWLFAGGFPGQSNEGLAHWVGVSDPESLESGLGGIRGRAPHSARRLGSLLRAAGTDRKERVQRSGMIPLGGTQEIIRAIYWAEVGRRGQGDGGRGGERVSGCVWVDVEWLRLGGNGSAGDSVAQLNSG